MIIQYWSHKWKLALDKNDLKEAARCERILCKLLDKLGV